MKKPKRGGGRKKARPARRPGQVPAPRALGALRERIRVLENTIEHMDQGVSIVDAELRIVSVNRRSRELLGIPARLCPPGTPLEALFRYNAARGEYGPGDVEEQVRARIALARRFEAHCFERERPDGTILEVRGLPIPGGGFVTLYTDVTQRARSERALKASEARYDMAMRAINEGVYDYDIANDSIYYSDRIYEVLDSTRELLRTASDWRRLIHPDDIDGYIAAQVAHMKGETGRLAFDCRYRARDGSVRWARQRGLALRDASGRAVRVVGSISDITELKQTEQALRESEARLAQMAHYDALTGLPNRALILDRLRHAMARAERARSLLAVLFLDLDRFKEINDSLGHAAGDAVLKEAASRLRACLRSADSVGRLGGDEFTVILEDARDAAGIAEVARKIVAAFAAPAEAAGRPLRLSTSVGIAVYAPGEGDAELLLKRADGAMYQAKREGGGQFCFYAETSGAPGN